MEPGIYIIATPIGNLDDMGGRALRALREADLIMAEDTRRALKLLNRYEISGRLESCHKFNEARRACEAVERALAGAAIGFVTSAGMPGVSDPGARLVRECVARGAAFTVIPGPSAATAALAASGFGGGGFHCEGFLPRKPGQRSARLRELVAETVPVVLFESPHRCFKLLDELESVAGERRIFLGRELTKLHEEKLWGTASELKAVLSAGPAGGVDARRVRGEVVMVLEGAKK